MTFLADAPNFFKARHNEWRERGGTEFYLLSQRKAITGATNASPVVITSTGHGFATGDRVVIVGVVGNTAANGFHTVTVIDADHYSLNGVAGNGVYTSGGGGFKVWKAVERTLAQNDFPGVKLESLENALEFDPKVLDCLPDDFACNPGDHIVYPASGDPYKDRRRIEGGIQPKTISNKTDLRYMLTYADPEPR